MLRLLGVMFALMIMFASGQAHAVCSSPSGNAGDIIYNATQRIFQYCDNTNWKRMNILPGTGSGGCTSPTLPDGQMVFNADHRILQGCAGNVHRPFTPIRTSGGAVSWKMIATGGNYGVGHACGIKTDNTLWCWGANSSGQLGDNTTTNRPVHTQVSGGGSWKFVATGTGHTCGIKADNTLWCWGHNGSFNGWGQLGNNDGSGTQRNIPTAVSGGGTWKYVAAGNSHTCGIKTDDTLWCWGGNQFGRTGLNITADTDTLVPTQVNGGGSWKQVAAGNAHTCAIRADDTMRCWGEGANGRLGTNSQTDQGVPTTLSATGSWNTATWKALTAGEEHTCAIRNNDVAYCWGNNWLGQAAQDPDVSNQLLVPTAILGGGTWKKISATTAQHTCAIRSDDTMSCWGFNEAGQGGNGNFTTTNFTPVAVSDSGPWAHVSAGAVSSDGFTCGIKTNGSLKCWGANMQGQLGINTMSRIPAPMATSAGGGWKKVSTGESGTTCAIRIDDTLWCWGSNVAGQLGIGIPSSTLLRSDTPIQISGGGSWTHISVSTLYACGIKTDQSLWCWGTNFAGQMGINTQYDGYDTPQAVSGGGTWKEISTGGGYVDGTTCGIKTDDTLWCWGDNADGQTGLNTSTGQTLVPAQVASGTFWKKIGVGSAHACGIRTDDALYCWGDDGSAQLGNGATTADQLVPVLISGGTTWKHIGALGDSTCGVRLTDDALLCWGNNNAGNLGDGSGTQRNVPTAVSGGGTWNHADGGGYAFGAFSCGLRMDGTAWCWGNGSVGQLGSGSFGGFNSPNAVTGGHTWKLISSGSGYTCAIKSDDSLWCWGDNDRGQLTATGTSTPSQSTGLLSWCSSPTGSPGAIVYNSTQSLLQFCDGAGWVGIRGGVAPPPAPEGIPTSGLVSYWSFNEGSGTTANDTGGNSNHGTLNNGPTWVAGRVGAYAINFDGVNDEVFVSNSSSLAMTSSHTVALWAKLNAIPGAWATFLAKGSTGGANYYLQTNTDDFTGGYYTGSVWNDYTVTTSPLVTGSWFHLAGVYDDAANTYKLYINGVEVLSSASNGPIESTGTNGLYIGTNQSQAEPINTAIDEVRLYNRALGPTEIQALANQ